MRKRVVIGMSGGVDSSVTAAFMQEAGYECIGMHLKMWEDRPSLSEATSLMRPKGATLSAEPSGAEPSSMPSTNKCCNLNGVEDARWVCEKLGIPFYVMNAEREFKERVVDYFLEGYAKGETPNPCVECNRSIKFGLLLERAKELNADFLASGHYAKVLRHEENGEHELWMADDKEKDQSYFLYTLTSEKLAHVMFPLGNFRKTGTYELARKFGLTRVIEKQESQGLCFFAEGNPKYFLMRSLPREHFTPGPITDLSGRKIGTHRGLTLYTIGQRQGLGIGGIKGEPEGEAWYVVSMDRMHNRLVVGRKKDIERSIFVCSDVNFISSALPAGPLEISVRIRHRGKLSRATLELKEGNAWIKTHEPLTALALGQSAVFYKDEKLIGGGIIKEVIHEKETSSAHRPSRIAEAGVSAPH
jgi:tRNA-specific 2-thiouridylase